MLTYTFICDFFFLIIFLIKDDNSLEIRKVPDISETYSYSGSITDFKELINNHLHMDESLVKQTESLNIIQRPQKICNYLKSLLPLWCSTNVPLNDISSSFLCPKISNDNLKIALDYTLNNIRNNNEEISTNKYENLISPKNHKPVSKSIFKI